jgi:hypothetical protein
VEGDGDRGAPGPGLHDANPDDDLLYQIDSQRFRRYEPANDPTPIYEEQEEMEEERGEPED